jgi:hypothetical protein
MDRTVATGTGYIGQYPPEVARLYESLETCPDNLLLFMHHVPYTYMLHSGKTVIQYVYDSHYDAAEEAQQFPKWWEALRGRIDERRYQAVLNKLNYQAGHAIVWRDAICTWFLRESGIADVKGRAGHFPDRIEAESMQLDGYAVEDVAPSEDASRGKAVGCGAASKNCTASFIYKGNPGWRNIDIQYFDGNSGVARFELFVGKQLIESWVADANLPSKIPNGDTSTRKENRRRPITAGRRHPNHRHAERRRQRQLGLRGNQKQVNRNARKRLHRARLFRRCDGRRRGGGAFLGRMVRAFGALVELTENHFPGGRLQHACHGDVDCPRDLPPGVVHHNHGSVIQIRDTLVVFLTLFQNENPHGLAWKDNRP